jgi:hypothetical protein
VDLLVNVFTEKKVTYWGILQIKEESLGEVTIHLSIEKLKMQSEVTFKEFSNFRMTSGIPCFEIQQPVVELEARFV